MVFHKSPFDSDIHVPASITEPALIDAACDCAAIGGLLQIAHFGAGRHSLDARWSRGLQNVAGATA
jgi:uncharacterized membrane protein YphA (DoxX/SURF4 family)